VRPYGKRVTFRRLVLVAPVVYGLHILEEAPRFVTWTRLYPSWFTPTLSNSVFAVTNAVYMVLVIIAVTLCAYRSAVTLGLAVVAFLFSNALFHIGFTIVSGVYSPGTVTAILLYLPLTFASVDCARREGLLSRRRVLTALVLGVVVANAPLRIMQRWV
jgi:hypothetical protein